MPGLYSIATRAPGTLITAIIYNGDHQAHVDGRAAEFMQSYSVSLAQMNTTEDPLPGGVESLPISLAGEIARLRFEIAAIKTTLNGDAPTQWYSPVTTPALPAIGARVRRGAVMTVAPSTLTAIDFSNTTTTDFNSGVWAASPNPTRFTAPAAGKYYAAACVRWDTAFANAARLGIRINGTTADMQQTNIMGGTASQQYQTVAALLNLAANDYIEFTVFSTSVAAASISTESNLSLVGSLIYFGSNP